MEPGASISFELIHLPLVKTPPSIQHVHWRELKQRSSYMPGLYAIKFDERMSVWIVFNTSSGEQIGAGHGTMSDAYVACVALNKRSVALILNSKSGKWQHLIYRGNKPIVYAEFPSEKLAIESWKANKSAQMDNDGGM